MAFFRVTFTFICNKTAIFVKIKKRLRAWSLLTIINKLTKIMKKLSKVLIKANDCENGEMTLTITKERESFIVESNHHMLLVYSNSHKFLFVNLIELFKLCEEDLIDDEFDYAKQKLVESIFYYVSNYICGDHVYFNEISYYLGF